MAAYTNRFFLQLAFGEVPTLVMFRAVLLGAPLGPAGQAVWSR